MELPITNKLQIIINYKSFIILDKKFFNLDNKILTLLKKNSYGESNF